MAVNANNDNSANMFLLLLCTHYKKSVLIRGGLINEGLKKQKFMTITKLQKHNKIHRKYFKK